MVYVYIGEKWVIPQHKLNVFAWRPCCGALHKPPCGYRNAKRINSDSVIDVPESEPPIVFGALISDRQLPSLLFFSPYV